MQSIVSNQQCIGAFYKRLQSGHKDEIVAKVSKVEQETTGKKRGSYNTLSRTACLDSSTENLEVQNFGTPGQDPYMKLLGGELIPWGWKDVYLMCSQGQVPLNWSRTFRERDDLGDTMKEKAKFSQM